MKLHFIAIGGSVMSQLAIALKRKGNDVSGSDDIIFDPAKQFLKDEGILPESFGWFESKIDDSIDAIILGMHAKKDNPELLKALRLGIKIYSYPEYVFESIKDKKIIAITGSHGKTTTTAMIMHVLKDHNMKFDYLVGARLEGFDDQVQIEDNPIMIIEGDEYLSSAIHPTSKFHYYHPHITSISGIAWDHINAFPEEKDYNNAFKKYIDELNEGCKVIYYQDDKVLNDLVKNAGSDIIKIPYNGYDHQIKNGKFVIKNEAGIDVQLNIIGNHNLQNLKAAALICNELGINNDDFLDSVRSFKGAKRRLQLVKSTPDSSFYYDFAHAPSKVKASCNAVKELWRDRKLIAVLELHTYSSLNKDFINNYKETLSTADEAIVFFNKKNLEIKNMEVMTDETIKKAFQHPNIRIISDADQLKNELISGSYEKTNLLLMTSGNFGGLDIGQVL